MLPGCGGFSLYLSNPASLLKGGSIIIYADGNVSVAIGHRNESLLRISGWCVMMDWLVGLGPWCVVG